MSRSLAAKFAWCCGAGWLALAAGCSGGGGPSAGGTTVAAAHGSSASPASSAWSYPLATGSTTGSTVTGTAAGGAGASAGGGGAAGTGAGGGAGSSGAGSGGSGASGAGAGTGVGPAIPPGATLRGTIPADPATGFGGILWLVGERIRPGSNVLVAYQGVTIKMLPGIFFSSEVLGIDVFLTIPGQYAFTALAPDGTTSTPVPLTVASGGPQGAFTLLTPDLKMVFPPSLDTSFTGTVWLLGEHFMPGSSLVVSYASGATYTYPLVFTNGRSLGWVTATPPAGAMTLRILNPTLLASPAVTVQVGPAATGSAGGQPAPTLLAPPTSVATPFLGVLRVYGGGFVPGAVLDLKNLASGATTTTGLLFVSSAEVWWTVAYPSPGAYEARVRNPDGQATPTWPFQVQ